MPSIRRQLILGVLATLLLILVVSGAVLYEAVRETLVRDLDTSLHAKARALATLVRREYGGAMEFDFADEFMPEFEKGRRPEYFEIRLEDGTYLEVSHSLGDERLPAGDDVDAPDEDDEEEDGKGGRTRKEHRRGEIARARWEYWNLDLPDGRPGRAVSLRFVPQAEEELESEEERAAAAGGGSTRGLPTVVVVVAQGREEVRRLLRTLLAVLAGIGALLPVVVGLMASWVVRRGLRPLDRLAREVGAVDSRNLGHRFPVEGVPAELAPIGARLNNLLERLQKAFERERRFTANVAHELRTPVAELRSMTEVALMDCENLEQRSRNRGEVSTTEAQRHREREKPSQETTIWGDSSTTSERQTLSEVLQVAIQMEKLIGALLLIARYEAGNRAVERRPVALGETLRQSWKPHESRAAARNLAIEWRVPDALEAATDADLLQVIAGNLFSNAVDYAAAGSTVICRAERDGKGATLSVTNVAPDLAAADLDRLFEPFWRKDAARSDSTHTGLGLSLVAAAAALLGANPTARLSDSGELTVAITLKE